MNVGRAAFVYWGIVFALGFVLGTIRTLWLAPKVGVLPATAIELPVMLAASWWVAGVLMRRFGINTNGAALAMGALALALLMLAECTLAVVLVGQTPADWLANLHQPHALLGLAGQVVFALMPWLIARRGVSAAGT